MPKNYAKIKQSHAKISKNMRNKKCQRLGFRVNPRGFKAGLLALEQ